MYVRYKLKTYLLDFEATSICHQIVIELMKVLNSIPGNMLTASDKIC